MDQADSLRKMMDFKEGKLFGAVTSVPVISLVFAKDRPSNKIIRLSLMELLLREGRRVLHVTSSATSVKIQKTKPSLWTVRPSFLKKSPMDDFDLGELGVQAVLIDADSGIDEEKLCLHHEFFRTVVILTPEENEAVESFRIIKALGRRVGVKKMDVLVAEVKDAREGVRTFTQLDENCRRFLDMELNYLGSVRSFEKNDDRGFNSKFLLDLKTGSAAVSDLQLIAMKLSLLPTRGGR